MFKAVYFTFKHSPLMLCYVQSCLFYIQTLPTHVMLLCSKLFILHSNTPHSCYVVMFKAVYFKFKHSPLMLCCYVQSCLFYIMTLSTHVMLLHSRLFILLKHSPLMLCCYVQSCLFYIQTLSTHAMLLCSKLFILHSDTLHSCYVVMFKAVYFTFKHSPLMLCCYVQSCLFYIMTLSTHVMLLCSKLCILLSNTLHSYYVVMFKAVYFTF